MQIDSLFDLILHRSHSIFVRQQNLVSGTAKIT